MNRPLNRSLDAESARLAAMLAEADTLRDADPARRLLLGVRARRLARQLGDPHGLAWATHHSAGGAYRLSRFRLAERYAAEALRLFELVGDPKGQARARNALGFIAEKRGAMNEAYDHFHAALAMGREVGDTELEANVLNNLSIAAQDLGDVTGALEWALAGLDLARQRGDEVTMTRLMTNTATLYQAIGQPGRARAFSEESLERARRLGLRGLLATCHSGMAEICKEEGQLDEGLEHARLSLHHAREAGDHSRALDAQQQTVNLLLRLGRPQEAEPIVTAALDTARQLGDQPNEGTLLVRLGEIQRHLGRYSASREALTHAQRLTEQAEQRSDLTQVLLERSRLEEACGDKEAALRYFRAYHEHDKQVFGERQGRLTQAMITAHRVREIEQLNAQLQGALAAAEYAASHDPLTGALNRRAFLAAAGGELTRAVRAGGRWKFCVALLDADHFKSVNDRFGHQVGDEVLRALVQVAQAGLREADVVSRWGGEEFILLLSQTDLDGAQVVCERLRAAIEAWPWSQIHPELRVTASIGVAAWQGQTSIDPVTDLADAALYQAKFAGRNRVCVHGAVARDAI